MKRRTLLAAPALLVGAEQVEAATESPVAALFREWRACQAWAMDRTTTDEEFDRRCAVRTEIEMRLYAEPARDARDICLKFLALSLDGDDFMDDAFNHGQKIVREARELVGVSA